MSIANDSGLDNDLNLNFDLFKFESSSLFDINNDTIIN